MAMQYYEDEPLRPSVPADSLPLTPDAREHTAPNELHFETDLADMRRGIAWIQELADIQPGDGTHPKDKTNVPIDPPQWNTLQYITLKQMGYPIVFTDAAVGGMNQPMPDCVEVRTGSFHRMAVIGLDTVNFSDILARLPKDELVNRAREQAILNILRETTYSRISVSSLMTVLSGNAAQDFHFKDIVPLEDEGIHLLKRAFMTSTLLGEIKYGNLDDAYTKNLIAANPEKREVYEALAADGVRPINYEELYLMAHRIVRYAIKLDGYRPENERRYPPVERNKTS